MRFLVPLAALAILATACQNIQSLNLLNEERQRHGVHAVIDHGTLSSKAQAWAEHLARQGYLQHSNLSSGAGPGWSALGENVAQVFDVEGAHRAFMNSSSHRRTMLNPVYTHVGIGIAEGHGYMFVVHVFGG